MFGVVYSRNSLAISKVVLDDIMINDLFRELCSLLTAEQSNQTSVRLQTTAAITAGKVLQE